MGKKTEKKCCAVLLIFVFLLQDPYLLRAGRLDAEPGFLGEEVWTESDFEQASEFAISYCLNGGIFPKGKKSHCPSDFSPKLTAVSPQTWDQKVQLSNH